MTVARKSWKYKRTSVRRFLLGHTVAVFRMAICILAGTLVLWKACGIRPVARDEAILTEATFRQAIEEWRLSLFRQRRIGYRQDHMILQFYDHEDMVLLHTWDDIAVAEELPYTDKRYRPVLLSDLEDGTTCIMLTDPKEPNHLLHLETEDGKVIVPFEASIEAMLRSQNSLYIVSCMFLGFGILSGLWLLRQYRMLMRKIQGMH